MRIDVLSIFPEMFSCLDVSILGRAKRQGQVEVNLHNIRDYSQNKNRNTDDYPYGGGAGMLMTAQPIASLMEHIQTEAGLGKCIYMSPRGVPLTQALVKELAGEEHLTILCGHYEGVDERIVDKYVDMEISIGDYVLTGGELPAMVLIDSVSRHIDGVLGSQESAQDESFSMDGLLEYPQYTRPAVFEGMEVPQVLLNGHHAEINKWRRQKALEKTWRVRPDLLRTANLSDKDRQYIQILQEEEADAQSDA